MDTTPIVKTIQSNGKPFLFFFVFCFFVFFFFFAFTIEINYICMLCLLDLLTMYPCEKKLKILHHDLIYLFGLLSKEKKLNRLIKDNCFFFC